MEMRPMSKSFFPPILFYSILAWTIICFIGTWFVILGYGILQDGLIPTAVTLFFAAIIWAVPFSAMVLFYLYVTPVEKTSPRDFSSTV